MTIRSSKLEFNRRAMQFCIRQQRPNRRAMTLLELMVVLMILIAVAAIVIPSFSDIKVATPTGERKSPTEVATEATMLTVREAITGQEGVIETLSHCKDAMPISVDELVQEKAPPRVAERNPELIDYDPVNRIGWRGPYVSPTGRGQMGEPTIVDGWGNPLQMQADFDKDGTVDATESKFMRVVSAGPNGEIETPDDVENMKPGEHTNGELTLSECGDDLVMFLRYPDYRR